MFKKYPEIKRLGHEESDGILIGLCHIQEKIDGANTSIWKEGRSIKCGSRTQILTGQNNFRRFLDYVKSHKGIKKILKDYPQFRLYGEWLVRHTLIYNETAYNHWYMFDIFSEKDQQFLPLDVVYDLAKTYEIKTPQLFAKLQDPAPEDLEKYLGITNLGEKGEGLVIKNFDFKNKFGDCVYAKCVTQKFKEDNAIMFGGNNKHSKTYWEMWVVNKFMTLPRVRKIMNKLEPLIDRRLDMEHTPRIINTAYHDMITEEIWEIQKKVPSVDFKILSRLSTRKAAQIYHDLLGTAPISVADLHRQERLKSIPTKECQKS